MRGKSTTYRSGNFRCGFKCIVCGGSMARLPPRAIYCSPGCRQKAYRQRRDSSAAG